MAEWNAAKNEELAQKLDDLEQGKVPRGSFYSAIWELGKAEYWPAKPVIERYLSDDDVDVRIAALMVLANRFGERKREYWEMARELLADPFSGNREEAITILTMLKRNTQDVETLQLLASVVNNPEEEYLERRSAYAAMHEVIHFDPLKLKEISYNKSFDLERDIDWDLVRRYLKPAS